MPKPEHEFFDPGPLPWRQVAGSVTGGAGGPGVSEKILAHDPDTGDVTRLLRFEGGVETTETITHDFWEEVWIVEGTLIDLGKRQTFTAGMYACRPPAWCTAPTACPRAAASPSRSATARRAEGPRPTITRKGETPWPS